MYEKISDPKLVLVEVHNPHDFPIWAHRDELMVSYIRATTTEPGRSLYKIAAKGFQLLPHHYFAIRNEHGDIMQVVANYGDAMGKRNTKISKPQWSVIQK